MIELIKADYYSLAHRCMFYNLYCDNILYTRDNKEPSWADHCEWYKTIFAIEDLYLIKNTTFIIGYIRMNKKTKEISIALKKVWQDRTLGSQALELLDEKPLLAKVQKSNKRSLHFFRKHNIPIEVLG